MDAGERLPCAAFDGASWISRAVPAGRRTQRSLARTRVDWAEPGHRLGQTFRSLGEVTAVSIDVAAPPDAIDPYAVDVAFTLRLETAAGELVTERSVEGPQLVWEPMGQLLQVTPPAPPGEYRVVLLAERETVGWFAGERTPPAVDDGVSPLVIDGAASVDGKLASGVRSLGVDTVPAPNPRFRTRFELDVPAASATISAAVLGNGFISINGFRVGSELLEPAITDYDQTILYRTWGVAHLLRPGMNEILIDAGRDRFAARGGDIWGWYLAPWHREPTAIARLVARGRDGTVTEVATGDGWETTAGPVVRELLFGGEDWVLPAAESWVPATIVAGPKGSLAPAGHPPIVAGSPLSPIVVQKVGDSLVLDFGQQLTGRVRCVVSGRAGAVVKIRTGEQRDTEGHVVCENQLAAGEAQLDTLVLRQDVEELIWEPQFSYRGFRWAQIDITGEAHLADLCAIPLVTELEIVGELTTGEPLLEWIDSALGRTFRNNLHGIPTDTPIYEKNGWTADAHLATEALLHHFDLRSSFGKWINDHIDAQSPQGDIPWIVPTPGWGRGNDPAWSASAVLIPWQLYQEYGDLDILDRVAPMTRRFADRLLERTGTGVWTDRCWGDWLAPGGHGVGPEGMAPIGTIMSVTCLQHAVRILHELGDADASSYDLAAADLALRYHDAYFDRGLGHYRVDGVGYRQALNILPLAFGAVPAAAVASVQASLIADIENRTAGHLDCGAIGVRHLLGVLSDAGRDDLALTVLLQKTPPGWGAWYRAGECTLMESWDPTARSRDHYFLGAVAAWIQQRVGGLRSTSPGWTTFEIAPICDDRVTRARIRHRTPLGWASVRWERGPGGWQFDVGVPDGAVATLLVDSVPRQLTAGIHHVFVDLRDAPLRRATD